MEEADTKKILQHIIHGEQNEWFCRLCCKIIEEGVALSDQVSLDSDGCIEATFANILQDISGIPFQDDVELPQFLCADCSTSAIHAFKLKNLCLSYASKWTQLLNSFDKLISEHIYDDSKTLLVLIENDRTNIIQDDTAADCHDPIKTVALLNHYCHTCNINIMGKESVFKQHMNTHSRRFIKQPIEKMPSEQTFECQKCQRQFSRSFYLEKHLRSHVHQGVKPICEHCGKILSTHASLNQHVKTCQGFLTQEEKELKREQFYLRLKQDCVDRKRFECHDCGLRYSKKRNVLDHIKMVHLKQYNIQICPHCGKKYKSKSLLRSHLVIHTRERNYICMICQRGFVTKPALTYHTRLHTGEKPFQCDLCPERFLNATRRAYHRRIAHIGRQELCNICNRAFHTQYAVRKHMRQHMNPKSRLFAHNLKMITEIET